MESRKNYQKIDSLNTDNSLLVVDDDIIPYSNLKTYFPIPEGIRMEEFAFIKTRLINVYQNAQRVNFQKDVFDVYYTPKHFIIFLSIDDFDKIVLAVKYMKGRPELDSFIAKYDMNKSFKEPFIKKGISIKYIMTKFKFRRFKTSKFGSINYNYQISAMIFRLNCRPELSRLLPKFQFENLIQLSSEIEFSMKCDKWPDHQKFWIEYNKFWEEFGYEEIFNPWEYARAFVENMLRFYDDEEIRINNIFLLLRLNKTQLFGQYGDVDGLYYYLWAIDLAIEHKKEWNSLPPWVTYGLKIYGDRPEVSRFCRNNRINLN